MAVTFDAARVEAERRWPDSTEISHDHRLGNRYARDYFTRGAEWAASALVTSPPVEMQTHALASALDFATMPPEMGGVALAYIGPRPEQIETAQRMLKALENWGITVMLVKHTQEDK
jgi:hypothetical protein